MTLIYVAGLVTPAIKVAIDAWASASDPPASAAQRSRQLALTSVTAPWADPTCECIGSKSSPSPAAFHSFDAPCALIEIAPRSSAGAGILVKRRDPCGESPSALTARPELHVAATQRLERWARRFRWASPFLHMGITELRSFTLVVSRNAPESGLGRDFGNG
jgi:hypothetical protein